MADSLLEIRPQFERATGHELVFLFAGTPELIRQATSGMPFDLGRCDEGRGRAGRRADDRYFPRRLRGRLQERRAEARCRHARRDESRAIAGAIRHALSGERGRRLCDQNIRASRHQRRDVGQDQAAAAAERGLFLTNLLIAPGVELAGPFPAELQNDLVFVGAVAADSNEADAAKAFIAYLKTPEAAAVFRAKGVKPG
jgi:molybdate transport system substrate-binding protein